MKALTISALLILTGCATPTTKTELKTRCERSLRLHSGHQFFTAGQVPLATATLSPDGKTLDITMRMDRIAALMPSAAGGLNEN